MSGEQYVELAENELGVDKIATSPTAYAFFENLLAVIRGAPTAPSVSPWAFARTAVTAGEQVRMRDDRRYRTDRNTHERAYVVTLMNNGVVRCAVRGGRSLGSDGQFEVRFIRRRANVETTLSTQSTTGGNFETFTYDMTIQGGDSVCLDIRSTSSGSTMSSVWFELRTTGEILHPFTGGAWYFGTEPV